MPTTIVFSGGSDVTVEADANEVRRVLSEDKVTHGEPFTAFRQYGTSATVYVAVDAVACIKAVPDYGSASS